MQWLKDLFTWLAKPLVSLLPGRNSPVLYWTLHVLVILLIVLVLGLLNWYTGLENVLRTRFLGLNRVWLPLLFLLGYALFWMVRGIYLMLGPEGAAGEFDDIEEAWAAARVELEHAGLDVRRRPVYLVVGEPAGGLEQFFAASRLAFQVRNAPPKAGVPLHVHATREAIFVTCEGASLLPMQTRRLLEAVAPPATASPITDLFAQGEPSIEPTLGDTLGESGQLQKPRAMVLLLGEKEPAQDEPVRVKRTPLVKETEIVDLQTRRLRHVCRLLFRERQPYCPVNGILVVLPMVATATPEDASETAAVMRHDLHVARSALQLDCPRLVVLCDAETLPGFATLVQYFPEGPGKGERYWVIGQNFPLVPDVRADQLGEVIEAGMTEVGDTLLPSVIGRLWMREGEGNLTDRWSAVVANVELYQFLNASRQRVQRLGRLASRGVSGEGVPTMLGGCYLAGTGADGVYGQGFLAGVLRRALELQNSVRWTQEAESDDAAYHRYTRLGYVMLVVFVAVVVWMLWMWW